MSVVSIKGKRPTARNGAPIGRVRYGMLCQDDGGVVDDVTLNRTGEHEVLFCVNASNIAADLAWMRELHARAKSPCDLVDESEATALLAIVVIICGRAERPGLGIGPGGRIQYEFTVRIEAVAIQVLREERDPRHPILNRALEHQRAQRRAGVGQRRCDRQSAGILQEAA